MKSTALLDREVMESAPILNGAVDVSTQPRQMSRKRGRSIANLSESSGDEDRTMTDIDEAVSAAYTAWARSPARDVDNAPRILTSTNVPLTPFPDTSSTVASRNAATIGADSLDGPNLPSPTMSPTVSASHQNIFSNAHVSTPALDKPLIGLGTPEVSTLSRNVLMGLQGSNVTSTINPLDTHQALDPSSFIPTLADIPSIISTFDTLPPPMQSYLLLHLLRRCPSSTLQFVSTLILPTLKRDFLGTLPYELCYQILGYLDLRTLGRCMVISKRWKMVIEGDGAELAVWKRRLHIEGWYNEKEVKEYVVETNGDGPSRLKGAVNDEENGVVDMSEYSDDERDLYSDMSVCKEKGKARPENGMDVSMGDDTCSSSDDEEMTLSSRKVHTASIHMSTGETDDEASLVGDEDEVTYKPPNPLASNLRRPSKATLHSISSVATINPLAGYPDVDLNTKEGVQKAASQIPNLHKVLYKRHHKTRQNWIHGRHKTISFPGHGSHVVTCLQFDDDKIVSGYVMKLLKCTCSYTNSCI
jgi:hypothetical protein